MFAPCQEKEEMMPKGTQLTFIFTFTFTGGSSIEGERWGRYKQFHIQRGMGPDRWLIIHAIHYIHIKVMPENANAVNQLYNCVKLPAVIVQVYQPLKCSLAKSHSRQGRNDICGIKSKLEQTFDYFSRGAGQEEQCHLWLLSGTLCGHNIHHTYKVNLYFTPVFKK